MGIPVANRLRRQREFDKVCSVGKRSLCGPFIFQWSSGAPELECGRRLGVIASRRVGNAVVRNRGKRLIRELFRRHQASLPASVDLVVVLRSSYRRFNYAELESRFLKACAAIPKK